MSNTSSHINTGVYGGLDDPPEAGGFYQPLFDPADLPPFQLEGDYASPSEQSTTPGDHLGNDAYGRDPPFYLSPGEQFVGYDVISGEPVARPMVSPDTISSPTLSSYLSPGDPDIQEYPSYGSPAVDSGNVWTAVNSPIRRNVMGPPLPVPHADITTFEYDHINVTGYIRPQLSSTSAYHHQIIDQSQSLRASPNHGHYEFYNAEAQGFPHSYDTRLYTPLEEDLPVETNQVDPVVARETGSPVSKNPSASGPSGGGRNEEATGSPVESPQLRNPGGRSRGSKKKKEAPREDRDEASKAKRRRRKKSILLPVPPQGPIQATPPFLLTRPGLRAVPQLKYQCGTSQGNWTELPPIEFTVKGTEGIRLTDAMNNYFSGLDNRDDLMFTNKGIGASVSCRTRFDGYQELVRQIPTKNYKTERAPIDGKKLAHDVAKCIKVHLEELEEARTPFYVPFEDMFLVRFIHVAKASWQPEIWYQPTSSSSS